MSPSRNGPPLCHRCQNPAGDAPIVAQLRGPNRWATGPRVYLCETCQPLRNTYVHTDRDGRTFTTHGIPRKAMYDEGYDLGGRLEWRPTTCTRCNLRYRTLMISVSAYCPDCQPVAWKENSKPRPSRRKPRPQDACEQCEKPMAAGRSDSRFCSSACRQKAYRARKRPNRTDA